MFGQPNDKEFEQVKQLAEEFWLDNENMLPEQFRILKEGEQIIAFGRLREHNDVTEFCTLGVAKDFREKGYGKQMVKHLLNEAKCDVYLVTVLPDFFTKLGFTFVEQYPNSLQKKVKMCSAHYHVGETYRVMKWERKEI